MNVQIEKKSKGTIVLGILACIVPMLAFLGIQVLISIIIGIVVGIYSVVQMDSSQLNGSFDYLITHNFSSAMPYILLVTTLTTTTVGFLWYHFKYAKKYDYSLKEVATQKDYIMVILAALGATFAIDIVIVIVTAIFPHSMDQYSELIENAGIGSSAISFITAAFLAPIGEECFFRGVIQRKAEKIMPFLAANVLQALLFGIVHWNIVQSSYAFVLGLILGYIRHKYQSVRMGVVFHMVFNILGQTLPMITENCTETVNIIIVIASVVLLGVALKMMSNVDIPQKTYVEPMAQYNQPMAQYNQPMQQYNASYGNGQPMQQYNSSYGYDQNYGNNQFANENSGRKNNETEI